MCRIHLNRGWMTEQGDITKLSATPAQAYGSTSFFTRTTPTFTSSSLTILPLLSMDQSDDYDLLQPAGCDRIRKVSLTLGTHGFGIAGEDNRLLNWRGVPKFDWQIYR
jgi:hypothetical protein